MPAERRLQRGAVVGLINMDSLHLCVGAMVGVAVVPAVDPEPQRWSAVQALYPSLPTFATP